MASSAITPLDEDIKSAVCLSFQPQQQHQPLSHWGGLIKAEVGQVGGGGHPVGVSTPSGVGARQETRRDLYNSH